MKFIKIASCWIISIDFLNILNKRKLPLPNYHILLSCNMHFVTVTSTKCKIVFFSMWHKYGIAIQKLRLEMALQNSVLKVGKCIIDVHKSQINFLTVSFNPCPLLTLIHVVVVLLYRLS